MDSLTGKKILVLGLGISGQSAVRFLLKRRAEVFAVEDNHERLKADEAIIGLQKAGLAIIGSERAWNFDDPIDLVVTSPGVPSSHPYYQEALARNIEIIGEVELACRELKRRCIAITGTNGKTTVTLLVAHILNGADKKAWALGNIGVPLTEAVDSIEIEDPEGIFVIELSSFQLETLRSVFVDVGMILNITSDHLDRYHSFAAYAQAKIGLGQNLKPTGKLLTSQSCMKEFQHFLQMYKPQTYGYTSESALYTDMESVWVAGKAVFSVPDNLRGRPSVDLENMLAAYAICKEFGISDQLFVKGFKSFKKPQHRIQFIKKVDSVSYYDDSKGTNIDAVIRAVETMQGDVILIAGGVDKGAPYQPWVQAFADKVKFICAIGEAAQKIKNDLDSDISIRIFSSLEEAVKYATKYAPINSNVLLSPGCSSYDMFSDYAHRGREFQRIVHTL